MLTALAIAVTLLIAAVILLDTILTFAEYVQDKIDQRRSRKPALSPAESADTEKHDEKPYGVAEAREPGLPVCTPIESGLNRDDELEKTLAEIRGAAARGDFQTAIHTANSLPGYPFSSDRARAWAEIAEGGLPDRPAMVSWAVNGLAREVAGLSNPDALTEAFFVSLRTLRQCRRYRLACVKLHRTLFDSLPRLPPERQAEVAGLRDPNETQTIETDV